MHTVHEAIVQAAPDRIFGLVAEVEGWPALDPAYRWCRILERGPDRLLFEMAGLIRGFPAKWTATQDRFPTERRIRFHHVRGITTGMVVEWHLVPSSTGVRVTLTHDLALQWPVIGRIATEWVVGPVFIDWIATRTIRQVKRVAEED